jgi:putative heme-binding domain-containing protein
MGALLAMARRGDAEIARFLTDADADLRADAARAIHDTPIPAAMPALAKLAYDDAPDSEAVDWRAINANRAVGMSENGEALVHLAALPSHAERMRVEALDVVGEWPAPHGQCRVTGNWRPCQHPGGDVVKQSFFGSLPQFLADPAVAAAACRAAAKLGLREAGAQLAAAVGAGAEPEAVRLAALDALAELDAPELAATLGAIGADAPVQLRQRAGALLSKTAASKAVPVLASLLDNAGLGERQAACEALGGIAHTDATAVLGRWLDKLPGGDVPAGLQLDLIEAASKHEALAARAAALLAEDPKDPLAGWRVALAGGDRGKGRSVFYDHEATRCTRCHMLGGSGGNAGPALDGIGKKLAREQLLEALLAPSARIAEGFGTTTVRLHDGTMHVGVITKDQDGEVVVAPATGEPARIPATAIASRTPNAESAMPKMGGPLSRRQVRDLVEFLSRQKKD